MDRTVVVAGGGVSGSALALSLARAGVRCLVLERSTSGAPRPAACLGEHLPPAARPYLTELGLWERFRAAGHLPCPGTRAAWGAAVPHDNEYIFNPYGHGWNLDRAQFNAWLLAQAQEAGAAVYQGSVVTAAHRVPGGWAIEARQDGERKVLHSDFLVDATGRASAIARRLGSRRISYDHLTGVIRRLPAAVAGAPADTGRVDARLLIEAVPDGWWYAAALPDGALAAAFMADPPLPAARDGLPDLWAGALAQTTLIRERAAGLRPGGPIAVHPAGTYRVDPLYGLNWLAAGDAAAGLDPLSSLGITHALASGLAAGRAIVRHLDGDFAALAGYAAGIVSEFDKQLAARRFYYRQEQRWPDRPFWRRRQ